jgi:hypothetical protein
MEPKVRPTNPEEEVAKGRIALWLDPDDIKFIADEWRKIPDNVSDSIKEIWGRIAFRAMAALHKSGMDYEPKFPDDSQKYNCSEGKRVIELEDTQQQDV